MSLLYLIYISLLITITLSSPKVPIIAIYSNPLPDNSEFYTADYVNSNPIRWLESSGAGVVVIHAWHTTDEIDEILTKVNGVFFQGGSKDLSLTNIWEKNAKHILYKAIKMNKDGDYFPILGICQGFELLHALIAGTVDVLSQFDSYNVASPLILSNEFDSSKMFAGITDDERQMLKEENIAPQFHHRGIKLDAYIDMPELDLFFKVSTYARDVNGHIFVNTVEGRDYPIYATQHHPEKVNFERHYASIPNSLGSTLHSQRIAQFFVNEAKKNKNVMEMDDLIKYDYIDTMINVKKIYYFQNATPVRGENSGESLFLAS